ncbi:MAG: hypothetical protein LBE51_03620 [Acidovorax sp.]|jgi:hypothetical protein|nr:hypothetical protein [Acidovorax sp.]
MHKYSVLAFLFASISSFAQTSINNIDIVGKWSCATNSSLGLQQSDTITIGSNNRFSTSGVLTAAFNFATMQPDAMAYYLSSSGTWAIRDGGLSTRDEKFTVENSNPKIKDDALLDLIKKEVKTGETDFYSTKFIDNEIWIMKADDEKTFLFCLRQTP